jgi:hypothetical protein
VARFQLVFRGDDGDQSECLVVDGETYILGGVEWLVRREHTASDMPRFVCTLVAEAPEA